jgi:PST family polysaccharide transporter
MNVVRRLEKVNASHLVLSNQIAKTTVQFLLTVILSRHLSPERYGAYAFALVYVVFLEIFRDFGFSSLAMQRKNIHPEEFNWSFWILAIRGMLLSTVMFMGTYLYDHLQRTVIHKEIVVNLAILAFVPFLAGLNAAYNIAIVKEDRILLAIGSDFFAFFLAAILACPLLLIGWSATLLSMQLVTYHLILLVTRVFRTGQYPSRKIPHGLLRNLYSLPPFLGFTSLVKAVSANIDSLLIGSFIGVHSLGIYNRAFQLSQVPIQQALESQTYLVLQRTRFGDRTKIIKEMHSKLSLGLIFVLSFIASNSHTVIFFLYGSKWDGTAVLLSFLSVVGIIRVIEYKIYWIILAFEKHKLLLKINIAQQFTVSAGIIIGLNFGIQGVCLGLLIAVFSGFLVELFILRRKNIIVISTLFSNDLEAVLVSIFINGSIFLMRHYAQFNSNILYLIEIIIFISAFFNISRRVQHN